MSIFLIVYLGKYRLNKTLEKKILTLVFASILLPLSSNNLTMLLLPLFDAT